MTNCKQQCKTVQSIYYYIKTQQDTWNLKFVKIYSYYIMIFILTGLIWTENEPDMGSRENNTLPESSFTAQFRQKERLPCKIKELKIR